MHEQTNAYIKGLTGELAAESHFISKGYDILFRRYASPWGEIDLIVSKEDTLAFAEVKTRSKSSVQEAQSAVSETKRKRIIQTAKVFLSEHAEYRTKTIRFDVVTVTADGVTHVPDAFQGNEWD